jgi:oxygen-independent coproporphyrinogen-3 oxidase
MAEAYEMGCDFLAREGYRQYEISNFALPGFESRHNRKYWQLAPYLGLGAGAHSFDKARRWSNQVEVRNYLESVEARKSPIVGARVIDMEEQVEEFFFLGLRQSEGIDLNLACERWGAAALAPWADRITQLERDGWLIREGGRIRLSRRAYLVSNEIFQEFVSV